MYLDQDSQVDERFGKNISLLVRIAVGRSRGSLLESRLQEVLVGRILV